MYWYRIWGPFGDCTDTLARGCAVPDVTTITFPALRFGGSSSGSLHPFTEFASWEVESLGRIKGPRTVKVTPRVRQPQPREALLQLDANTSLLSKAPRTKYSLRSD